MKLESLVSIYPFRSKRQKNTKLQIKEIAKDFKTRGANIEGLLSTQFVNKVLSLLQSGDYTIVE